MYVLLYREQSQKGTGNKNLCVHLMARILFGTGNTDDEDRNEPTDFKGWPLAGYKNPQVVQSGAECGTAK